MVPVVYVIDEGTEKNRKLYRKLSHVGFNFAVMVTKPCFNIATNDNNITTIPHEDDRRI